MIEIVYSTITDSRFYEIHDLSGLSQYELMRYKRFKFENDRRRFLAGRSIVRQYFSASENLDFNCVRIDTNNSGKPYVAGSRLEFSISHSGDITAVAFADSLLVGLDIELRRKVDDMIALSNRFFSTNETDFLNQFSGRDLEENFFRIWCAKEAYVKATGNGLRTDLKSFSVTRAGDGDFYIHSNNDPDPNFILHEIDFGEDYNCFLCVRSGPEEQAIRLVHFVEN